MITNYYISSFEFRAVAFAETVFINEPLKSLKRIYVIRNTELLSFISVNAHCTFSKIVFMVRNSIVFLVIWKACSLDGTVAIREYPCLHLGIKFCCVANSRTFFANC